NDRAKSYFLELFKLDFDHRLDTQNLAFKVIALAEEARKEQLAAKCCSIFDEAQNQLQFGNSDTVVKLIGFNNGRCLALTLLSAKTAELIFKDGLESFRKSRMTDALQKFCSALDLDPENELASQYVELTQTKLEVNAVKTLIAWRK